jgi:hypothetical protein
MTLLGLVLLPAVGAKFVSKENPAQIIHRADYPLMGRRQMNEFINYTLKVCWCSSTGEVLACQAQGPEFKSKYLKYIYSVVVMIYNTPVFYFANLNSCLLYNSQIKISLEISGNQNQSQIIQSAVNMPSYF